MRNLVFRPLATKEVFEAYDWYNEKQAGLGNAFLEEIQRFGQRLLRNPEAFSYYKKPVRQGKISRFPYLVVFEVFDAEVIIYSVFMSSRSPSSKRIK